MKVDSLQELESAFATWRRGKKYAREPIPEGLRTRAQRAAKKHGMTAVVRVTRVERTRLLGTAAVHANAALSPRTKQVRARGSTPTFSRLTLSAPTAPNPRPIAEVEMSGVTLRVFEQTPELMGLLGAACGMGATR